MRKEERPLLGGKSSYGATPQHTARRCAWPQRRYVVTFLGLGAALTRLAEDKWAAYSPPRRGRSRRACGRASRGR